MKGGLRPGLLPYEERVIDARRKTVSVLTAWAHMSLAQRKKKAGGAGRLLRGLSSRGSVGLAQLAGPAGLPIFF